VPGRVFITPAGPCAAQVSVAPVNQGVVTIAPKGPCAVVVTAQSLTSGLSSTWEPSAAQAQRPDKKQLAGA
jgi:hypothetical protein